MSDIWMRNTNKKAGIAMLIVNIAISLSTLLLKQHSIIDIIFGALFGFFAKVMYDGRLLIKKM